MNDFPTANGVMHPRYDTFFKWIPKDHYGLRTDPDDPSVTAVVRVTDDLRALFKASVIPPDPAPEDGYYIIVWNNGGTIHAYSFDDDFEAAVKAFREHVGEDFAFGEEADLDRITVLRTDKPASVVAPAEATVRIIGEADYDEVLDAGLKALDERRERLFAYGIRPTSGGSGARYIKGTNFLNVTVIVYANRD